jgi:peptidoglycan hydrolase-like protein with peptidoglycan-binding domain
LAGALTALTACASTTLASTPAPSTTDATTSTSSTSTSTSTTSTTTTTTTSTTTTTVPPTTTTVPPETVPAVDPPIAAVGTSNGAETARAQQRLLDLGFWLQEADGQYGLTTRQAVMAFQKYHGVTADGVLGEETAALLSSELERPSARADAGTLVEVDKGLQLLFFVIDGRTTWVLNTSTGSEIPYDEPNQKDPTKREVGNSVTRNGLHKVYRQREQGWWEGDLGQIYRPKYFTGGIAVHGSNHVPNYPASHGCVRVSVPAMDWIWENDLMPMNIPVWVHEGVPG